MCTEDIRTVQYFLAAFSRAVFCNMYLDILSIAGKVLGSNPVTFTEN